MRTPTLWFALLAGMPLYAQDLPKGQVIDRVTVRGNDRQSYALYIPSNYSADRRWPMLYCLDPGARGRVPVERFAKAAEQEGFLVAGSNNARNGPIAISDEAIRAMANDTNERFAIDGARIYAAGLSGGARLALAWAQSGGIQGVVASSAGFGSPAIPKQVAFRIFATAGVDDFNHDELYRMSRELAKRGVPHRFVEFEGGHEWLPESLTGEALAFFLGRVPPQAAAASKQMERLATQYDRYRQELASSSGTEKAGVIARLKKDAGRPQDDDARRVARRVMGGLSVESMERGRELMAAKQYGEAAALYETAVLVRPENAGSWYSLAVAQCAAGNVRRALEALEHAAEHGFRDVARIEQEPLLSRLKREARYQAVIQGMRP